MGKTGRSGDRNKNRTDLDADSLSSENMPCSPRPESFRKEKSSDLVDSGANKQESSVAHHRSTIGRSIFLKRAGRYFSCQGTGRKLGKNASAGSTSRGKSTRRDDRLCFKLSENKKMASKKARRITCGSWVTNSASPDAAKIACGVCQKLLKRKSYCLGDALSSREYTAVAVLVCGHVYHADCLEEITKLEDRHDPPCPWCSCLVSQDFSRGQG